MSDKKNKVNNVGGQVPMSQEQLKAKMLADQEARKAKEAAEAKAKADKIAEDKAKEAKKLEDAKKAEAKEVIPAYVTVIEAVDKAIASGELKGLQKADKSIYVGYYKDGRKVCGINKSKKPAFFFHNENVGPKLGKVEGLEIITKEVAKKKHYGSVKALYTGSDAKVVIDALKVCNA